MNKKGFTLIELIISLGLLGLVGILIVTNATGMFTEEQDKEYERYKNVLENAACAYLDLSVASSAKNACNSTGSTTVPISTLLGLGLINEKDIKNAKAMQNENINVSCVDGVKTCTYND